MGVVHECEWNATITDQTTAPRGRDIEKGSKNIINVKQQVPINAKKNLGRTL